MRRGRKMKKISLFAVSLMIAMVLCGVSKVSAEEVSIPNEMQPETIIEYISDTEYVVLQGGESNQEKKIVNNELPETGAYIVEKLPKPVKGDVATKQAYDNCPTGTVLQVRHNGKFVNMKKWDVGSMPNAVLDIWKTGVEYWGYKWSSTFSIPGYVEYEYCL